MFKSQYIHIKIIDNTTNKVTYFPFTENDITKLLPNEDAYTNTTIIPPRNIITREKKNQGVPE